jgi:hypothetical protein
MELTAPVAERWKHTDSWRCWTAWLNRIVATIAACGLGLAVGCRPEPAAVYRDIEIKGSDEFVTQIRTSLSLLAADAPEEFESIATYVKRVEQHPRSGMDVHQDVPTYQLTAKTAFHSATWCAGVIAHESHHSKLFHDGDYEYGMSKEELACNAFQMRVMTKIGAPQHELKYLASLDGTHFDADGDGKYTADDYRRRDW